MDTSTPVPPHLPHYPTKDHRGVPGDRCCRPMISGSEAKIFLRTQDEVLATERALLVAGLLADGKLSANEIREHLKRHVAAYESQIWDARIRAQIALGPPALWTVGSLQKYLAELKPASGVHVRPLSPTARGHWLNRLRREANRAVLSAVGRAGESTPIPHGSLDLAPLDWIAPTVLAELADAAARQCGATSLAHALGLPQGPRAKPRRIFAKKDQRGKIQSYCIRIWWDGKERDVSLRTKTLNVAIARRALLDGWLYEGATLLDVKARIEASIAEIDPQWISARIAELAKGQPEAVTVGIVARHFGEFQMGAYAVQLTPETRQRILSTYYRCATQAVVARLGLEKAKITIHRDVLDLVPLNWIGVSTFTGWREVASRRHDKWVPGTLPSTAEHYLSDIKSMFRVEFRHYLRTRGVTLPPECAAVRAIPGKKTATSLFLAPTLAEMAAIAELAAELIAGRQFAGVRLVATIFGLCPDVELSALSANNLTQDCSGRCWLVSAARDLKIELRQEVARWLERELARATDADRKLAPQQLNTRLRPILPHHPKPMITLRHLGYLFYDTWQSDKLHAARALGAESAAHAARFFAEAKFREQALLILGRIQQAISNDL